ncbi:MAG: HTH domain-containing protein [Anaerobiospirillum succiniciproducens]|uniref:HTH domain-containing protein n=1 Tax=Anaerobiospirillum succiniciproducens TaxID=13335 RepID=UPI002A7614BC|nr:HTH domain-containing protein [Anaerobiospirillum succiniciproducens]MDY2798158.1 HTH domain-containing protein [Anaerobiospirillum succiniciproducens]
MLDINKQLLIRRLSNEGLSQREIAKQTGISRTTIRSYISDPERGKVLTRQKSKTPRRISVMTQGNQEMLKNDYIKSGYNSVILSKFLYEEPAKYGLPEGFNLHVRSIRRYIVACQPFLDSFIKIIPAQGYLEFQSDDWQPSSNFLL